MMGELFGFIWCAIAGLRLPPNWATACTPRTFVDPPRSDGQATDQAIVESGEGPSQDHAAVWLPTGHVRESVMHWQD
jgi:hypothetical protein